MKSSLIRRYKDKEEKATYLSDIGEKNIFFSKYIVILISIFEIIMLVYAVIKGGFDKWYNCVYLASYVFLLICSVLICVFAWVHENKRRFSPRTVEVLNSTYFILIIAWSMLVSFLDSHHTYQLIVYLTVVMGTTSAVRLRMSISVSVQIVSGILMLLLLSFAAGCGFSVGQSINLIIFIMISVALTLAAHNRGLDEFRQKTLLDKTNQQLSLLNEQLNDANEKLKSLADHDPLTGAHNRLVLSRDLDALLTDCKADKCLIACAIMDVDNFKKVNDTYGHLAGDESLCAVANIFKNTIGDERSYRYGGEEFVGIWRDKNNAEIFTILEKVRKGIEQISLPHDGLKLTASIGFCVCQAREDITCDFLLSTADNALYAAKAQGKNRICEADD